MSSRRTNRDHLSVRTQSERTIRASQLSAIFGQVIHYRSHSFVLNVIQFILSTVYVHSGAVVRVLLAQVHLPHFDLISQFSSTAEANNKLDITIRMCRDAHTRHFDRSTTTRIWIVLNCVVWRQALICWVFYSKIVLFISLFIAIVIVVVVDAVAVVRLPPSLVVIIVSLWTVNTVRCRNSFEPNPHSNVWRAHDIAIPLRIEISCDRCCCSRCWCYFFFLEWFDHTLTRHSW